MKTFKELLEGVIQPNGTDKIKVENLKDTCWKGYEAIGAKKKNGREVPNCVPVKEEALDEGKMAQLHADIEDHLSKHIANYKKMGGAEHLGNKTVEVAKKIAKLHNISHEAAQKHVNDYVDHNLKEETEAEKAAKELKLKLTKWKNQQRAAKALGEAEDKDLPFTPDKPHGPIAKAGKHGYGPSAARHLARMGLKKLSDKKEVKEEAEQIDELDKETLGSYVHKSFAAGNELHNQIDKETDPNKKAELKAKLSKRNTGIMKAGKKLREDVSMLSFEDYLKEQKSCKKEELHPNQKKLDKNNNGKLDSDDFVKLRAGKKEVDEKYVSDAQRKAVWASKNEKGVKEETELDEAMTPMQKLKDALDRHSEKAIAANKAGDHEAVKVHQSYMNKIKTKMGKLAKNEGVDLQEMEELCEISKATLGSYVKKAAHDVTKREVRIDRAMDASGSNYNEPSMQKALNKNAKRVAGLNKAVDKLAKEETEQIDEISKATLASYIPKAAQSARFSGMVAQDMQNKSDRARSKGMKDSFHRISMKYKNKAWDREDNIKKAAQKLAKEEVEQIDELDKKTLGNYIKKAHNQLVAHSARKASKYERGDKDALDYDIKHARKEVNREGGIKRAVNKLTKEDTEVITFKQLMENISEAKIDDLKDRIAARKATQSAYDKDYKPAAKSNVQKVKGHSYGAGEEEGEDDEDTKKVSKPAAPEVKRGRGRPAGSKSGARN